MSNNIRGGYELVSLVDGTKINKDDFTQKVEMILRKYMTDVKISTIYADKNLKMLKLIIEGPLEDVNNCHIALDKSDLYETLVILKDDPGMEIRLKAYPILAKIELQLREFIGNSIIEIFGFDWWHIAPEETQNRVMKIEKNKDVLNKLELTNFSDLIVMVKHSHQTWNDDRQISADDLKDIISDCGSIEDIKLKIDVKLHKISLWDNVFSKYFNNNIESWMTIKERLSKYVIPFRHQVMHHRPMYSWQLIKLLEIEEQIDVVLKSRNELKEEDIIEANRIGKDIFVDINHLRFCLQLESEDPELMRLELVQAVEKLKAVEQALKKMGSGSLGLTNVNEDIKVLEQAMKILKSQNKP